VVATTMPTRTPLKPRPTDAGVLRSRGEVAQTEPGLLRTSLALGGCPCRRVAVGESVGALQLRGFSRSIRAFGVSRMINSSVKVEVPS
jgi:hypothetical protein